jgi:hypothetical protein
MVFESIAPRSEFEPGFRPNALNALSEGLATLCIPDRSHPPGRCLNLRYAFPSLAHHFADRVSEYGTQQSSPTRLPYGMPKIGDEVTLVDPVRYIAHSWRVFPKNHDELGKNG